MPRFTGPFCIINIQLHTVTFNENEILSTVSTDRLIHASAMKILALTLPLPNTRNYQVHELHGLRTSTILSDSRAASHEKAYGD